MCRLLGYASPIATTVHDVLGPDQVPVFQDMARLHSDGWGSAWVTAQARIADEHHEAAPEGATSPVHEQVRIPTSGLADAELTETLVEDRATARIVHLRMASQGMACRAENTHPFTEDGMSFAHNGALKPVELIESLLHPDIRDSLVGTTDSERYFAAIRSRLADGDSLGEAVRETVATLRERFPLASMNALLLSPTHLVAVHASESAEIPHDDFDRSGMSDDELPRDHRNEYYLMRYRHLPDGTVVFASSGLDIAGWTPLPAETVAIVDLRTLQMTLIPIVEAEADRDALRVEVPTAVGVAAA